MISRVKYKKQNEELTITWLYKYADEIYFVENIKRIIFFQLYIFTETSLKRTFRK